MNGEDDWNQGGRPQKIKKTIIASEITNLEDLYDIIYENGPVYDWYANNEGEGHAIVITGVSLKENKVYTNNPWGVRGKQSFNQFNQGFTTSWWMESSDMTFDRIYILE